MFILLISLRELFPQIRDPVASAALQTDIFHVWLGFWLKPNDEIFPRNPEGAAFLAETPLPLFRDPHPIFHGYPSGQLHVSL